VGASPDPRARSPSPSSSRPTPRPVLVIVASLGDAHRFTQDLRFFGAPRSSSRSASRSSGRAATIAKRKPSARLNRAAVDGGRADRRRGDAGALDTPLPTPGEFREGTLRLATKDSLDRELLLEALEKAGYERADSVVEVGQWSARGGIVDVFSPMHPSPARLEFERRRHRVDPPVRSDVAALDGDARRAARAAAGRGAGDGRRGATASSSICPPRACHRGRAAALAPRVEIMSWRIAQVLGLAGIAGDEATLKPSPRSGTSSTAEIELPEYESTASVSSVRSSPRGRGLPARPATLRR